ncbi:MAG: thiol:disulfide interchange protein, partial [Paraglaciecola psychrophila]
MTAIRLLTTAVLLLLCQAPLQAQLNAIDPLTSTTGNRVGDNLGASLESRLENVAGNGTGNSAPNNRQSSLNSPEVIAPVAFLAVDQAYILNVEGPAGDGTVRINWQIASDYYLYRHNLKFQLLDDNNNTSSIEAIIPAGLAKEDEYFGQVEVYYHNLDVMLNELPSNDTLTLAITYQGCADAGLCYPPQTRFYKLDSNGARALTAGPDSTPAAAITPSKPATSVPLMLLLALIGGAILNLMPCVFPVLSLKVLSFANNSEQSQGTHGLVYSAGVILSFVAVAAVLISLQSAGEAIGWGFQLQSPWFVAGLCYLFFTLGLSLSGLIEFGGQWMNTGNKLAT